MSARQPQNLQVTSCCRWMHTWLMLIHFSLQTLNRPTFGKPRITKLQNTIMSLFYQQQTLNRPNIGPHFQTHFRNTDSLLAQFRGTTMLSNLFQCCAGPIQGNHHAVKFIQLACWPNLGEPPCCQIYFSVVLAHFLQLADSLLAHFVQGTHA